MNAALVNLAYLAASVLFIVGLKKMSHPRTAVAGNTLSAVGMLIAIVVTLLDRNIVSFEVILIGLAVGAAAGAWLAIKVQMTEMPQMVALLNGLGGLASMLVAGAALIEEMSRKGAVGMDFSIATAASGLIGAVTFTGSMVAWGKLQGVLSEKPLVFPFAKTLNAVLALACLGLSVWLAMDPHTIAAYWILCAVALVLGVLLTTPIGGADMPVVIALLNSYSGLAGAATGFVLYNNVLIIAGSLVGASGIILSEIMCRAMNRSLTNVLFGATAGAGSAAPKADDVYGGKVKGAGPDEIAMTLDGVRRVVIVPGYGMAVAQAQHAVRDLTNLLESKGAEVLFAIHPVAGRMPGHMNVLLAEADIPYDKLKEMDEINPLFAETDVALIIGANDVVNPVAREQGNPISGMPILDVDKARTVIVVKRSLSPGFAGIPNPLFAMDNTLMYFADGKKAILDLVTAVKEL